jgi:bifunctional UDP-N-acetylglucosamine pyrophosphorylase / glucosamine-1-phosphate N-acetyltransferase
MNAPLPKVLHPVAHRALLDHAIDTVEAVGCERVIVVVGPHSPEVGDHVRARLGAQAVAVQDEPLGTGHAVRAAEAALKGFVGDVVVTFAADIYEPADIGGLFAKRAAGADVAVLGYTLDAPGAYGRLIIDGDDDLTAIVEAKEASPEQLAVRTVNSGVIAADASLMFALLSRVTNDNKKGEYYLTDIVGLARGDGRRARVVFAQGAWIGVDSQAQLADAEAHWQRVRRAALMADGVRMTAPESVYLAWDTRISGGAVVEPYVVFGPGVTVEAGAVIRAFSHLEGAHVSAGALIGPYARLRPGAEIGEDAHIGNFVEVKKVKVGKGAKANHLTYLGDGTVGAGANIGAGTIFCNYDGFDKHETHVGEGAFIGSNTALVAPVRVGPGAYTGSGSVITKDVPADALAVERNEQKERPGWAAAFRKRKLAAKAANKA